MTSDADAAASAAGPPSDRSEAVSDETIEALTDYRTIVVGTDGSTLAEPTVARAAFLARYDDADLVIVCAYSDLPRRQDARNVATLGGDSRDGEVIGREAANQALQTAVAQAGAAGVTVVAALLVNGDAAESLLKIASDRSAEVIVIGATRSRTLAQRLLGTVATEVVKRASCDVLVVRPQDGASELPVPESGD